MKDNKKSLDRLLDSEGLKTESLWDSKESAEHMRGLAKMTKVKYDELIKQGFDKHQALELCKNVLSMSS